MKGILKVILTFHVFVGLRGQEFCDSYANKSSKVLVFSTDNQNLFIFIGKYFWILNEYENHLIFNRSDRKAFGKNDEFGHRMTTIFGNNYDRQQFVFYDVRTLCRISLVILFRMKGTECHNHLDGCHSMALTLK